MRHIEEHILELYVLNSDKVSGQRERIEVHLAECHGCRSFVAQMTETYQDVEERFNRLNEGADSSTQALTRSRTRVTAARRADSPPAVAYRPVTRVQRITYFVRRHPVITGGSSFMVLAGLALLGNLVLKLPSITDKNPAHIQYNTGTNEVEVLNKRDQPLWKLSSRDLLNALGTESETRTTRATIADINGDGGNEVVTTLWAPEDALRLETLLRVYDGKGELLFKVPFEKQIKYLNRSYPNMWGADRVIVGQIDASGQQQIMSSWNCGRSPFVVTRLDSKGNVVGEYWHFGLLGGMFLTDANGDGQKELILTGRNDVLDSTNAEFPAIVVVDPSRIVGASKSAGSPGFHLPLSNADLYYLRLPVSTLSRALGNLETVASISRSTSEALDFWVTNNREGRPERTTLEYIFSRDFKVQEVKSSNVTDALYRKLVQEGKLSGKLDAKYLEDLKNGVRYWDGKEWRKEAVKVQHENVALK